MIAKRHKGIRPTHELILINWKKSIYMEEFPDGAYRVWNLRMLKSGCGKILEDDEILLSGCIYCHHCDEYFNEEQWEVVDGQDRITDQGRD